MPIRATFPDGTVRDYLFAEEAAQPFDMRFLDGRLIRANIARPVTTVAAVAPGAPVITIAATAPGAPVITIAA